MMKPSKEEIIEMLEYRKKRAGRRARSNKQGDRKSEGKISQKNKASRVIFQESDLFFKHLSAGFRSEFLEFVRFHF